MRGQRSALLSGSAGLGVAAVVIALRAVGWFQGPELAAYGAFLNASPRSSRGSVVLVQITEEDIREQGHWPISDRILAEALQALAEAGARVIGLDLYRDLPVPPGSEVFEQLLRDESRIVAVRKFGDLHLGGISAPPALEGTDRVGFNDILVDPLGEVVRRALLFQDGGRGDVESAFALVVALRVLAEEGIVPLPDREQPEQMRLGAHTLRPLETNDGGYRGVDAAGFQIPLDYASKDFDTFRLGVLLRGEIDPVRIKDRIVIVGSNAKSLPDVFPVPRGGRVPGMELHAHIVDQLLRQARGESVPLRVLTEWQELALILFLSLLGSTLGLGVPSRPLIGASALVGAVAAGVGILGVAGAVAFRAGWWVPVVAPVAAWIGSAGILTAWVSAREHAQRSQLMRIFARHVSAEVADDIWGRRDEFFAEGRPRPQRLVATVLFVDLKGYTAQVEKMDPARLMDWVNRFMDRMASLISEHGGVVDDYFGDGIKANFGVPIPRETEEEVAADARCAVRCALAMDVALRDLNVWYASHGFPTCAARIGIDTGSLVAGSLGSAERLKYTVVGNAAVTAQRLESTGAVEHDFERSACRILASEHTCELLDDRFETESVGAIPLKGKREPLRVWRILGRAR